MSVGFPVNKSDIDAALGQVSIQLRDSISRVPVLYGVVSALSDAQLTALSYSADDIVLLRAAVGDLQQIHDIAYGVVALPTAYDFRTNISKVTGVA